MVNSSIHVGLTSYLKLGADTRTSLSTYADRSPILGLYSTSGVTGAVTVVIDGSVDPTRAVEVADELAEAFARFAAATREHAARQVAEDRATEAVAHFTERCSA